MAETEPYTYTDSDGDEIRVGSTAITVSSNGGVRSAYLPKGDEAVRMAEAVLAAGWLTGHLIIAQADLHDGILAAVRAKATRLTATEEGARSMRDRALATLQPRWDLQPEAQAVAAEAIAALPLVVDDDTEEAEGEPCRSFTSDPDHPDAALYCEHATGEDHSGLHYATVAGRTTTWAGGTPHVAPTPARCESTYGIGHPCARPAGHGGVHQVKGEQALWNDDGAADAPDFRARLVSELLGEDRQDAADLLAEDPEATWEKAYAVWSMESAELERLRDGESPVLDRVAQLERDMGTVEQRVNNLYASDGVLARLDALELAARERAQSGGAPRAQVAGGGFTEDGDH